MKKVLIGVLVVAVAGGLGFGSYKLVSSLKSKSDTTVVDTINNETSSTNTKVENETVSRELADDISSSSATDTNKDNDVVNREVSDSGEKTTGGYIITDSAEGTTNFSQFGNVDKFLEEYNKYIDSSVGTEYVYLGSNIQPPESCIASKAYQVGDYLTIYTHIRNNMVMYVTINNPNKKLIKAHLGEAWSVFYEWDNFMTIKCSF